jgi:hypothetical protein
MDKVKEGAGRAKSSALDLKDKVGEKVEDVQAKRKADDLLAELGRIAYAERTERAPADAAADVARLVGELQKIEEAGVAILPPV